VALERPVVVNGIPPSMEASVEISIYPEHAKNVDTLIQPGGAIS
jgi:hypothetical protein